MKRRDFLTNTALIGAGIPLGVSPVALGSCSGQPSPAASKTYSPDELGMFSFVDIAPIPGNAPSAPE